MFEIGIFSVIVLAVSYWAVLWVMGRREDVLHGEFVKKSEPKSQTPVETVRPIFPTRPLAKVSEPERPVQAAVAPQPAFQSEKLDSLLHTIKQDLNQLVQK